MEWIGDPTIGDWLRERLDEPVGVVPHGYPAYVRVLHPARVRSLPDRAVPTIEEWHRMPAEERDALVDRFIDEPATWADTAAAFGTVLHPLAQWQRIVRTPPETDWNVRVSPDGREFTSPDEGEMAPELFAVIARHLAAHTATPEAGVAAIWDGWGELVGGHRSPTAIIEFTDDPRHEQVLRQSIHDPFNNVFRKPEWQSGILSDEISQAPRLQLPGRDYVTFSAGASAFSDPGWIADAPWADRSAEQRSLPLTAQHPNLLWPADRSWVMANEIDLDSTVVAGPHTLIAALLADPALEAFPIADDADLSWFGDEVNR